MLISDCSSDPARTVSGSAHTWQREKLLSATRSGQYAGNAGDERTAHEPTKHNHGIPLSDRVATTSRNRGHGWRTEFHSLSHAHDHEGQVDAHVPR